MPSRNRIDRAGSRLRKAETPDEADRLVYHEYRETFAGPLREIVEAVRRFAPGAPITHRLKRFETIVEKLRRMTTRLSGIEDIAGCRVVLPTMREQHEMFARIRAELEVVRDRDYQTAPRDGYRALHVVVRAQGRPVEVQVRTELEDQWANASERLAGRIDPDIKYGGGPPYVRAVLDRASDACGRIDELRRNVRDILDREPGAYGGIDEMHLGAQQIADEALRAATDMKAILDTVAAIGDDEA